MRIQEFFVVMIQWTWGIVQNLIGFVLFLIHRKERHFFYKGSVITFWEKEEWSLGIGMFIFLSKDYLENREKILLEGETVQRMKVHEYGHTIQSALLGPFFLPIIGLPSFIWANFPQFQRYRQKKQISYYSFYTEKWANYLGEFVTKEKAMR